MDDQLDNDLEKRIREVFDNYNDEHADEGWLLLREKYPEKAVRRPVVWLWWGSAAAILLLFLGILWYNNAPEKETKLVANKPRTAHPILKSTEPTNGDHGIKTNTINSAKADSVISSLQRQNLADNQTSAAGAGVHTVKNKNGRSLRPEMASNEIAAAGSSGHTATGNNQSTVNNTPPKEIAAAIGLNGQNKPDQSIPKAGNAAPADSALNAASSSVATAKRPDGLNSQDQTKKPDKTIYADNQLPKMNKDKNYGYMGPRVRLGIYAASYVNYAKGSNNPVNAGLGISSDVRISRKFSLSTGVAVVQNSLNFGSQLPPETAKLNATTASTSPSANALAAVAYSQNSFFAATPSLKNYNASLVGLDIPVNLKYQFNPEKSAAFVSVGLSSGTFVNETYTSTYKYVTPFASNLSQTTDQSFRQSFNGFYFAKTLNFSIGTGYRVAGNDIIIEPFLKYPLQGLGSQQIKFGSGGVNLKFSFPTGRK